MTKSRSSERLFVCYKQEEIILRIPTIPFMPVQVSNPYRLRE